MTDKYKVVYDPNKSEPWECYRMSRTWTLFKPGWIKLESTPTREEAETYCNSKDGTFIGVYDKENVNMAKGDESVRKEGQLYSNSGIPIKKIHAPNSPQTDVLDNNGDVIAKRVMFKKK